MTNNTNSDFSVRHFLAPINPFLLLDGVTEVAINQPKQVWVLINEQWECRDCPDLTEKHIDTLCLTLSVFASRPFSEENPILSALLPDGERVQCVRDPVTPSGLFSVTIRKPSNTLLSLDYFERHGAFDHVDYGCADFRQWILDGKTIVIAGETGSGKSTFAKALMDCIPQSKRLITIEDTHELFSNHPNQVNLTYPSEAKYGDPVTAATLLRSCLRMNPDRILLGELRGAETFDFVNVVSSGHGGSFTTLHASSCELAFTRMALMMMQNPMAQTMSFEFAGQLCRDVVDVVIHIANTEDKGRHIDEVMIVGKM
jgi:type IV secretion system protein VirB11